MTDYHVIYQTNSVYCYPEFGWTFTADELPEQEQEITIRRDWAPPQRPELEQEVIVVGGHDDPPFTITVRPLDPVTPPRTWIKDR